LNNTGFQYVEPYVNST